MWRTSGLTGLAVAVLLVTAACSETEPRSARPPQPLPTDFLNGGACEPLGLDRLPSDAGCASEIEGDADGDGSIDTLTVYALVGDDERPRSWHMRLATSAGVHDQILDAGNPFSYPRAVGAADVNGDGRSEWFVKTLDLAGHGTAWKQLNLFVLVETDLEIVTHEGEPLAMRVGGISRLGEGIACPDGHLALLRAEARNVRNTRWVSSARIFTLEGTETTFVERTSQTLHLDDYNDPALNRFYQLHCRQLSHSA